MDEKWVMDSFADPVEFEPRDDIRCAEAKQSDDGMGNTLVLLAPDAARCASMVRANRTGPERQAKVGLSANRPGKERIPS